MCFALNWAKTNTGANNATTLLFTRVLRDSTPRFVGPLVSPLVGPLVGWLVGWLVDWLVSQLVGRSVTLELKSGKFCIPSPAHPSATGGRVSGLVVSFWGWEYTFFGIHS